MRFGKVLQHHHKHVWVVQLKGEGEEGGGGSQISQVKYMHASPHVTCMHVIFKFPIAKWMMALYFKKAI